MVGERSELSANRFPLRLGVSPIRAKMRTGDARRTKTGLFAVMDYGEQRDRNEYMKKKRKKDGIKYAC